MDAMEYLPQEGVDYIVDLYAVVGVDPYAEPEDIKAALNQRTLEYHPDRLQGLADEFVVKGERMIRLLNRARGILLDPENRQKYDEILAEWEGPFSSDGAPIMRMDRYLRAKMADKSPEEIETIFGAQAQKAEVMFGYRPNRLAFIEKQMALAGDAAPADLREEYEDALLVHDRLLAVLEAERSGLLGLPSAADAGYRIGFDHSEDVDSQLEVARDDLTQEAELQALGGVVARLALLAGEPIAAQGVELEQTSTLGVPEYFDQQADKIRELAAQRQKIVEKRLANLMPEYPLAERQTAGMTQLLVGAKVDEIAWLGFTFDFDTNCADGQPVPPEIQALLDEENFEAVIACGYNVLTFTLLEQVDINDQLYEMIEKHAAKYSIGD